ncbi:hypothetical protein AWH49_03625 [Domibacillus aminovorans]|uniref:DUF2269 domain-containing protein n=1 Tax=Domibacillus aminovorans TaxID=29332 RepID=A0A177L068_9BACI|nr:hypothetical protein AWH49_03625 [Domibacillus aminovorans]
MNTIYQVILFLHIFSAVLSIGPFFVLVPMIPRMRAADQRGLLAYLSLFKSTVSLVKHAGHVLVTTGVLLVWKSAWSWSTSWVVMTIAVMVSSVFFLARAFSPVICRFHAQKISQDKLISKLHRSVWIYIALLMIMLWFMVAKPALW